MYMKRHLFKLVINSALSKFVVKPQKVFKYIEYLNSLFYYHILKCYSKKIMKIDATACFEYANDDVKNVKQHTRT